MFVIRFSQVPLKIIKSRLACKIVIKMMILVLLIKYLFLFYVEIHDINYQYILTK